MNNKMLSKIKCQKIPLLMAVVLLTTTFLLPSVLASTETYAANKDIDLKFTCTLNNAIPSAAARYNITISFPNGTTLLNNKLATPQGLGAFNYTIAFPSSGLYKVQMFCYDGTYSFSDEGFYDVTPTGRIQSSILENPLLIILLILGITLIIFGVSMSNSWLGFIGSIMFLFAGLYTMIYGFNNTTDIYTQSIALVLLGLGIIFLIVSAFEWLYGDGEEEEIGDEEEED